MRRDMQIVYTDGRVAEKHQEFLIVLRQACLELVERPKANGTKRLRRTEDGEVSG